VKVPVGTIVSEVDLYDDMDDWDTDIDDDESDVDETSTDEESSESEMVSQLTLSTVIADQGCLTVFLSNRRIFR
jgi:hypothetical protein